jgi:hypothetical protein
VLEAIKDIWRNDVPSKCVVFGWRLLLQRLSTRDALHHRGILHISQDLSCTFCHNMVEDCTYLFFLCPFSKDKNVWEVVFHWLGKVMPSGMEG